jgi:hypothetical protein
LGGVQWVAVASGDGSSKLSRRPDESLSLSNFHS